jgi:hypothetical protein
LSASSELELDDWLQAIDLASSLGQLVDEVEIGLRKAVAQSSSGEATIAPSLYSQLPDSSASLALAPSMGSSAATFAAVTAVAATDSPSGASTAMEDPLQRRQAALNIATGCGLGLVTGCYFDYCP